MKAGLYFAWLVTWYEVSPSKRVSLCAVIVIAPACAGIWHTLSMTTVLPLTLNPSCCTSRHQRMDILLCNGAIYLVFYKRIEQLEGLLPDDRWFSAPARAALAADRRTS